MVKKLVIYIVLLLGALMFIYPFFWMMIARGRWSENMDYDIRGFE